MAERRGISSILSKVRPAVEPAKKPSSFDRLMETSPLDAEPNLAEIARQVSERSTGSVHRGSPPEESTGSGGRNRTPDGQVHRNRTPEPDAGPAHRPGPPETPTETVHRTIQEYHASDAPRLLQDRPVIKTDKQRKLLAFLSANPSITTTYAYISEAIGQRKNTVRDNLNLFESHGLITKKTVHVPGSGVALEIRFRSTEVVHRTGPPEESTGSVHRAHPLKIDREKNLSISQERVELTWPHLARHGFGSSQIDQITQALAELGMTTDRVVQGLHHAEWELENGKMLDKNSQPVADPCSWVFRSLARTGYYRKPAGYVSVEEQAAKDEDERLAELARRAKSARISRANIWLDNLPADERKAVLRGFHGGNRDVWLVGEWERRGEPGES